MTKEQLHEKISEWFEPKPVSPPLNGHAVFSKKEHWFYSPSRKQWIALNYAHDEAANARLLEAMPEPELWLESRLGEPKVWACVADIQREDSWNVYGQDGDRKTAVVQAFYRWADIEDAKECAE